MEWIGILNGLGAEHLIRSVDIAITLACAAIGRGGIVDDVAAASLDFGDGLCQTLHAVVGLALIGSVDLHILGGSENGAFGLVGCLKGVVFGQLGQGKGVVLANGHVVGHLFKDSTALVAANHLDLIG